jgi:hypothetical protein
MPQNSWKRKKQKGDEDLGDDGSPDVPSDPDTEPPGEPAKTPGLWFI